MLLTPERPRRRRNVLVIALLASLLLHVLVGGLAALFGHRITQVVARLLPRPRPTVEAIYATSDAITIEKRTVPRLQRRAPPPRRPRARPQRPVVAQLPRALPVPTLAPVPTARPTAAPTTAPTVAPTSPPIAHRQHGTIHHPRSAAVVAQAAPAQHPTTQGTSSRLTPQQIAMLEGQMQRVIQQTQQAATSVEAPRRPPSTMKRYQLVMSGTQGDFLHAQGICVATGTWYDGPTVWHYMDCDVQYSDGYAEHVSIPWPLHFPRTNDPAQHPGRPFMLTEPPPGWQLPHPFGLSRTVCAFYKSACEAVVAREKASGALQGAAP